MRFPEPVPSPPCHPEAEAQGFSFRMLFYSGARQMPGAWAVGGWCLVAFLQVFSD